MIKILVLIPAFKAEKTISRLIGLISANNIEKENILVVDDGSLDSTYETAKSCGVKIIQHKKNKGKGEALKTGFEFAIKENYSGVITLDADLQHDPKFIPDFIEKAESDINTGRTGCPTYERPETRTPAGEAPSVLSPTCERPGTDTFVGGAPSPTTQGDADAPESGVSPVKNTIVGVRQRRTSPAERVFQRSRPDILVGTRERNLKIMPFSRWLTNNLTSMIVSIMGFTNVRDSQSGYRYISTGVLKSIRLKTKKYELESELLIKAGRKGFKISPVYISTIYQGSKSFINPFVDTGRFIKLMWKSLFW